ncbi:MAG: HlyD family efflux transporter periplasmic adaptor subunit, partial [Anaerovoracaceae bacterium]
LTLIVIYVVIAIIPSLTGALTRTEILQYGQMRIADEVNCYTLRDETVYVASQAGTASYIIDEGTQIKKNVEVLAFTPGEGAKEGSESKYKDMLSRLGASVVPDETYLSQRKGVVTYYIDGYEDYFNIEKIKELDYDRTKAINAKPENIKREKIEQGDPLYKICDNSNWYVAFWIEQANITRYEVGKPVTIELPKGTIDASVSEIIENDKRWLVVTKTNRYYEEYTKERMNKGKILTTDTTGLLVSKGCLTSKDDQVGVYVKSTSEEYYFVPVQVLKSDGKKNLVAEGTYYDQEGKAVNTVKVYDEVLKNPKAKK